MYVATSLTGLLKTATSVLLLLATVVVVVVVVVIIIIMEQGQGHTTKQNMQNRQTYTQINKGVTIGKEVWNPEISNDNRTEYKNHGRITCVLCSDISIV